MKIETRVYSASGRPSAPASSRGGGTLLIIVIRPSAGATIRLSPRGVVRMGSRKKANTQIVRPTSSQPMNSQPSRKENRVSAAAPAPNLRPSGCVEGKRHLTVEVVRSPPGCLSREGMRIPLSSGNRTHNAAVA